MIKKLINKLLGKKTTDNLGLKQLDFDKDFETTSPYGKCLKSFSFDIDVFEKGFYVTVTGPNKELPPFLSRFFSL